MNPSKPQTMLSLQNRRVIVTGGASGIGLVTARTLTDLGARVFLMDRDDAQLNEVAAGMSAMGIYCGDITSEADAVGMARAAQAAMAGIDGLVHCAGVSDKVAPALELDIDEWQRIVDVTLRGTFLVCREVARVMIEQGNGAIVTMSSIRAIVGSPRRNAYGPAKAAVSMLTKNLACEWSPLGVRINSLAPAFIRTPMVAALIDGGKVDAREIGERTPLGRLGEPEEIAKAAAFLLSDWASYITGATLPVDGGWVAFGGSGTPLTH